MGLKVIRTDASQLVHRLERVIAPHPLRQLDAALAGVFEACVLEALRFEPAEPVVIRFGLWDGDPSGRRYVCKVEGLPVVGFDPPAAWRWWSPLVATPAELSRHLEEALRARRPAPAKAKVDESVGQHFWGWGAAGQARA
jgi:hypothetical protein